MLAELVRIAKPGGRVAVGVRAVDRGAMDHTCKLLVARSWRHQARKTGQTVRLRLKTSTALPMALTAICDDKPKRSRNSR